MSSLPSPSRLRRVSVSTHLGPGSGLSYPQGGLCYHPSCLVPSVSVISCPGRACPERLPETRSWAQAAPLAGCCSPRWGCIDECQANIPPLTQYLCCPRVLCAHFQTQKCTLRNCICNHFSPSYGVETVMDMATPPVDVPKACQGRQRGASRGIG